LVEKARAAIEDGTISTTSDFGDLLDTCTVIAVSVAGYFDLTSSDMESTVDVSSVFASSVEDLAAEMNIERVRSTPDEYVFTAGLRSPGYAAPDALQFVQKLRDLLGELQAETSRTGEYRVGLSAGRVATGVLRGSELSFGIWGPTVRSALSLVAAADPNQVLVDGTVEDELGDEWNLETVDVIDLQDRQVRAFELLRRQDDQLT
jgi:class 3 adenylate cyclase